MPFWMASLILTTPHLHLWASKLQSSSAQKNILCVKHMLSMHGTLAQPKNTIAISVSTSPKLTVTESPTPPDSNLHIVSNQQLNQVTLSGLQCKISSPQ
ncbi:hypothetical protein ACHAWX_002152 [Stephanocyclus meneghinianus]